MSGLKVRILEEVIVDLVVALILTLGGLAIAPLKDHWISWVQEGTDEATLPTEKRESVAPDVVPPNEEIEVVELTDKDPAPSPPEEQRKPYLFPDGTMVYPHACDVQGKGMVAFDVVIFSDSFSWRFERVDQINGLGGEEEFRNLLARPYYQNVMKKARHIIVAGTASCEGTEWSQEDDRAVDRAIMLKSWLEGERASSDISLPPKSLHTLNLGRYWDDCAQRIACISRQPEDTLNQRKIILMAVTNDVPNLKREDFEACITGSMKADSQLDLLTQHYCRNDVNIRPNGEST